MKLQDNEKLESVLVSFIRNETNRIGLKKAVIGLSGGIDSAVSAALTVKALGPENVLCVMMPYKTSSKESITDAQNMIDVLKVRHKTVNISGMVDSYISGGKKEDISSLRKGNIMARMRMIVLYDLSSEENALVMGTGNKTEILLGYTTIYGDSACGINPMGELYKTQVWSLAEHLKVPGSLIEKKPSADLWTGQTDEGELGFTYWEVDKLLYAMVDEKKTDDELVKEGFDIKFIEKVKKMIAKNRFKSLPPLIAKIS